jgi:hypothetical protein
MKNSFCARILIAINFAWLVFARRVPDIPGASPEVFQDIANITGHSVPNRSKYPALTGGACCP